MQSQKGSYMDISRMSQMFSSLQKSLRGIGSSNACTPSRDHERDITQVHTNVRIIGLYHVCHPAAVSHAKCIAMLSK